MSHRNKKQEKKIARQRIHRLFNMAEQAALNKKIDRANRYVEIARKLSMRHLVKIPRKYKRRFCKHCYHYLLPGVTCRIRIHKGKVVFYCYNCKKFFRIPLNPKK
ncbi:MAG: ribonuclease P [Candidatus Thermoplasmatota archaeon]